MKKNMRSLIVLLVGMTLVGCGGPSMSAMSSWEGAHINRVMASFGGPSQILDGENEGKIYIFSEARNIVIPSTTTTTASVYGTDNSAFGTATTTSMPAQNISGVDYRMFYTDSRGIVKDWAFQNGMLGTKGNSWEYRIKNGQGIEDGKGGKIYKSRLSK